MPPIITILQNSNPIGLDEKYNFGNVYVGYDSLDIEFIIKNTGNEDLNLTGSPIVEISDWLISDVEIETDHRYEDNHVEIFEIKREGSSKIKVHFFNFNLEENYDYVYFYDGDGKLNEIPLEYFKEEFEYDILLTKIDNETDRKFISSIYPLNIPEEFSINYYEDDLVRLININIFNIVSVLAGTITDLNSGVISVELDTEFTTNGYNLVDPVVTVLTTDYSWRIRDYKDNQFIYYHLIYFGGNLEIYVVNDNQKYLDSRYEKNIPNVKYELKENVKYDQRIDIYEILNNVGYIFGYDLKYIRKTSLTNTENKKWLEILDYYWRWTGKKGSLFSPEITGDTIKIRFVSDKSVGVYGFKIDQIYFQLLNFSIITQPALSVLTPSQETTFTARFFPTINGTKNALVSILNDSVITPFTFYFEGYGVGIILRQSSVDVDSNSTFNFGSLQIGQESADTEFEIVNLGNEEILLDDELPIMMDGINQDEYELTQPTQSNIPVGSSISFFVKFISQKLLGLKVAKLNIYNNILDYFLNLNGTSLSNIPKYKIALYDEFRDGGTRHLEVPSLQVIDNIIEKAKSISTLYGLYPIMALGHIVDDSGSNTLIVDLYDVPQDSYDFLNSYYSTLNMVPVDITIETQTYKIWILPGGIAPGSQFDIYTREEWLMMDLDGDGTPETNVKTNNPPYWYNEDTNNPITKVSSGDWLNR